MPDFIRADIRDPDFAVTGAKRSFVIGVSRELFDSDMRRENDSALRQCFRSAGGRDSAEDVREFIESNFADAQKAIAGHVASEYFGRAMPPGKRAPVFFDFQYDPPAPTRAADGQIGDFPVWET